MSGVDMDWTRARCTPESAEDFFPVGDERQYDVKQQYEYTRSVCRGCPVRQDCLDWSIRQGFTEHGMFGGLTPKERRRYASGRSSIDTLMRTRRTARR